MYHARTPHADQLRSAADNAVNDAPVGAPRIDGVAYSGPRRFNRKKGSNIMALPAFNMRQLLEAGVPLRSPVASLEPQDGAVHLRRPQQHPHRRPRRRPTPLLHQALVKISDTVANGGRVLFVGTKRQASEAIAEAAKRSAQYYINHRWLGGTLTNWKTISQSIRRLRQLDDILADDRRAAPRRKC